MKYLLILLILFAIGCNDDTGSTPLIDNSGDVIENPVDNTDIPLPEIIDILDQHLTTYTGITVKTAEDAMEICDENIELTFELVYQAEVPRFRLGSTTSGFPTGTAYGETISYQSGGLFYQPNTLITQLIPEDPYYTTFTIAFDAGDDNVCQNYYGKNSTSSIINFELNAKVDENENVYFEGTWEDIARCSGDNVTNCSGTIVLVQ